MLVGWLYVAALFVIALWPLAVCPYVGCYLTRIAGAAGTAAHRPLTLTVPPVIVIAAALVLLPPSEMMAVGVCEGLALGLPLVARRSRPAAVFLGVVLLLVVVMLLSKMLLSRMLLGPAMAP